MKNTPLDLLLNKIMDVFLDKNNKLIGQIFYTKLGRLQIFLILTMIFGVLTNIPDSNISDNMAICMIIMLIYPIQLGLIMIVYAWIINPINNFKLNIKIKNIYKNLLNNFKKGDKK